MVVVLVECLHGRCISALQYNVIFHLFLSNVFSLLDFPQLMLQLSFFLRQQVFSHFLFKTVDHYLGQEALHFCFWPSYSNCIDAFNSTQFCLFLELQTPQQCIMTKGMKDLLISASQPWQLNIQTILRVALIASTLNHPLSISVKLVNPGYLLYLQEG